LSLNLAEGIQGEGIQGEGIQGEGIQGEGRDGGHLSREIVVPRLLVH
jgi:hypothetical protein